jgi:hypothetical protein
MVLVAGGLRSLGQAVSLRVRAMVRYLTGAAHAEKLSRENPFT